jgi:hypothetical protein
LEDMMDKDNSDRHQFIGTAVMTVAAAQLA